jgi:hypothetical protein
MEEVAENQTEKKIVNINVSRIIMGLTEIGNLDIDDFDTNYNISKTITNLGEVEKAYNKTLQNLMKTHIKVDEKGQLASENGSYIFNSVKDRETYLEAFDALANKPVSAEVWNLKLSELRKIKGIKGTTMAKCQELIDDKS